MLNCGRSLTCAALIAAAIIITPAATQPGFAQTILSDRTERPVQLVRIPLTPVAGTAADCTFALEPASFTHSASTGSGFVTVTTQTGCTWTAVSNVSWITITGGANASGSGTVSYTITAIQPSTRAPAPLPLPGQTF